MYLRPRGFVLITSLLLVLFVALTGRIAISLYPGLLHLERNNQQGELAQLAAESGLQYALSRLSEDPNWHAADDAVVIDLPGFYVEESQGNVIGLLRSSQGQVSQFRIRFNFQDGDSETDNDKLPDPSSEFWIDHPFVSRNNIGNVGSAIIPTGDGPNWSVSDPHIARYEIPDQSVSISVQGRAGKGLSSHSKSAANASLKGKVSTTVVESSYRLELDQDVSHAAIMAGSDLEITVPPNSFTMLKVDGERSDTPRLRSKGSVVVQDTSGAPAELAIRASSGQIGRNPDSTPGFKGNLPMTNVDFVNESVGDDRDFYNLAWNDVVKADKTNPDVIRIPAGTYVMWDDGSLHYYDMNFADYKSYMAVSENRSDPGTHLVQGNGFKEIRDPDNYKVNTYIQLETKPDNDGTQVTMLGFVEDTAIEKTLSGVTDFTVTCRRGAAYSPTSEEESLSIAGDRYTSANVRIRMGDCVVSAPGDIRIMTELVGVGATITSEGNFTLISPYNKMLPSKTTGKKGLNIYSRGDIKLSSYKDYDNSFAEMHMTGVLYSWGDFEALSGHESLSTSLWGQTRLSTIVAYGNEPGPNKPGANGNGQVTIKGSPVYLSHNLDSVDSIIDPVGENVSVDWSRLVYSVPE